MVPGNPLAGLRDDLAGRGEQFGQLVDRAGRRPRRRPAAVIMDAAFAQLRAVAQGPPQRPFRVDQQPLGLISSGGRQLGQFTGDAHHGGLGLVAAGADAAAVSPRSHARVYPPHASSPNLGARRTAGGLDPLRSR